jgi:Sugar kinases, ribokinase family
MKIVCLGEYMLRLSPPGFGRFMQASSFDMHFGGAEANVAASLAQFGAHSVFVTRLPEHEIGQAALNELRKYGVDTSYITRGGARLGLYYYENGASQRASKVIYDRAGSAFSQLGPGAFDWDNIFDGADWFHFTGITPALGDNVAAVCMEACRTAKKRGIKISCDLNYRRTLWSAEKAGNTMAEFLGLVDVCVINEEHADLLFAIKPHDVEIVGEEINREACLQIARQVSTRFGCEKTAVTLRRSPSASENLWAAMLYDKSSDDVAFSRAYNLQIIERVGGGDAFCAGLIWAMLDGKSDAEAVGFASAAAALKHSVTGDINIVSLGEVQALANGKNSGQISR